GNEAAIEAAKHGLYVIVSRAKVNHIAKGEGSTVVLVNCPLGGGKDEGQPGFTLILAKAVFCHQWVQLCWSFSATKGAGASVQRRAWSNCDPGV
ncbi:MAG: hypothetical protein M3480_10650, partial [Verrucomicrobiota bacterium]|nr:hypothetical protein [Verrucomicrobiota bacterium]